MDIITNERLKGSSSFLITKERNGKPLYQTSIGKQPLNIDGFKLISEDITVEDNPDEFVWCVSVPSERVIIRRNDCISTSFQCHSINAINLWGDISKRGDAKSFGYACMYGAQPSKLAKIVSVSLAEGEDLFKKYWDGMPALKALKEKVEAFWESTGKKYLISIDGRRLYVRSKHSLLNLLFQSAGALAMKYTTVEMCKQFEDIGLLGDPLEHSREDHKVFMMIVYHKQYCGFI